MFAVSSALFLNRELREHEAVAPWGHRSWRGKMSGLGHVRRILGVRGGSAHHPTPAVRAGVPNLGMGPIADSRLARRYRKSGFKVLAIDDVAGRDATLSYSRTAGAFDSSVYQ